MKEELEKLGFVTTDGKFLITFQMLMMILD